MKALIIGATGATGSDLTNVLLQDNDYTSVVIFVRKATGRTHPKLALQLQKSKKLLLKRSMMQSVQNLTKNMESKDAALH